MAAIIGKIANINGLFHVKGVDGATREISDGDVIYEGEVVIGDVSNNPANSIVVSMLDGSDIIVLGQDKQLFDSSLSVEEFTQEESVTQKDTILAMLEANGDVENIEDLETAAGEGSAAESSEGGEAVFAEVNNAATDINADLRKRAFEDERVESSAEILEVLPTEAPTTEAPTTEAPTTEAPTTEAPTEDKEKSDNSDANGKGGNQHDREDKDSDAQEKAEDKKDDNDTTTSSDKNGISDKQYEHGASESNGNDGGEGSTPNDGQLGNGNALLVSEDIEIDFGKLTKDSSEINSINLGDGSQTLTNITIEDVLDITSSDNILRIDGDNGDTIELGSQGKNSEWTLGDSMIDSETNQAYNIYNGHDRSGSDVTLEVSINIQVDES